MLPGDMAPQIPAHCPETPRKKTGRTGSSGIMDKEIKMMLASFFKSQCNKKIIIFKGFTSVALTKAFFPPINK